MTPAPPLVGERVPTPDSVRPGRAAGGENRQRQAGAYERSELVAIGVVGHWWRPRRLADEALAGAYEVS